MFSNTGAMPGNPPAPGVGPDATAAPVTNGVPTARDANLDPAPPTAQRATGTETRGVRFRRKAHRTRLYAYAIATVALVAFLIALAASNSAVVNVNWVFGSAHVSLVWLVLFAAILGWLLGLATSARFHWRTRAPRPQHGPS